MKAVIMAGGEGARLRPLTCETPKPMVPILGKPVMEHIINLLRDNGIRDIAVTLMYMSDRVTSYFEDGSDFGVNIEYFTESVPLGTAGSVGACREFLGDEDFLVISGDAVCDFDLKAVISFHSERKADLTIVTYAHPEPLEYGIVLSDVDHRIYGFVEKPDWGQVFSNQVNTGIYVVSGRVLAKIPLGRPFDFSRDLFYMLLRERAGMYACPAEGYWCDMGDCEAYLKCALDALEGMVRTDKTGLYDNNGILSVNPAVMDGIKAPAYIGRGVKLGKNVTLDHAVLEEGAVVGDNARISRSVVSGSIGTDAELEGAIVGRGALVGAGAHIGEGAVIGARAYVGRGCIVRDGVRIWPDKRLYDGCAVEADLTSNGKRRHGLMEDGTLTLSFEEPDALFFLNLGAALSTVFGGRIGVGCSEGSLSSLFADCIAAGICSCGSDAVCHDGRFAALSAWLVKPLGLTLSVHVEQSGSIVKTSIFDKNGLPLDRLAQRRLESMLSKGEINRATALMTGKKTAMTGVFSLYSANAEGNLAGMNLAVAGEEPPAAALREILVQSGARVGEPRGHILTFEPVNDGFGLILNDESSVRYSPAHVSELIAMCAFINGRRRIGVPYNAPAALDALAARYDAEVLRVGRDADALQLYIETPEFRDGCFAAVYISETLREKGFTLAQIADMVPSFTVRVREVECESDRGRLMRELASSLQGMNRELCQGIKVCLDGTWVHVAPCTSRQALRVSAEGLDTETAEEICIDFVERIKKHDKNAVDKNKLHK